MLVNLRLLFHRELEKLGSEITLYRQETHIWIIGGEIANSGGNLCLHLVGNLKTYIGKELGGLNYIRNRDEEFSSKDIPRVELLHLVNETMEIVDDTMARLSEESMEEQYPVVVFKEKMTTGFFLIHLLAHLSYHLGQLNYHRRLMDQ